MPDRQQTSTDDTSPERHAHHLRRRPGLFLFALLSCLPGLPDQHPGTRWVLLAAAPGKAGKYPGSAGHSTRILRPPPAPGKIGTASAAPDDHASSRPHHLRPICPAAYSSRPRRLLPTPCTACAAPMMTTTASRSARRGLAMARRRRGQILHLTGYSFASRGKAKRLCTALSIPQPPFFPGLPDEADGPPRPPF